MADGHLKCEYTVALPSGFWVAHKLVPIAGNLVVSDQIVETGHNSLKYDNGSFPSSVINHSDPSEGNSEAVRPSVDSTSALTLGSILGPATIITTGSR